MEEGSPRVLARAARLLLLFVLLNFLLFAGARGLFLARHVPGATAAETSLVLLYGARLDLALLAMETAALGLVCLVLMAVRPRLLGLCFGALTVLHLGAAVADLAMYAERGTHLGEPLVANLGTGHAAFEVGALVSTQPILAAAILAALALLAWAGHRVSRRIPVDPWRAGGRPARVAVLVLFVLLAFAPAVQSVEFWSTETWFDCEACLAAPRHYARLDDHGLHEAIVNPIEEILVVHLPLAVGGAPEPRLGEAEALAHARSLLGIEGGDPAFPLLREVETPASLGIENIWIVQVEGLSTAFLEGEGRGEPVMPFLRSLAARSLWFPNAIQSFNNTSGGMFATVTSLPRTSIEESTGIFTDREIAGVYGTLPRILGERWTCRYYAGFRETHDDFAAFMGSQGYETVAYPDLRERFEEEGRGEEVENALGLLDGPVLEACARDLAALEGPFVCHLMTGSTHGPWQLPSSHRGILPDERHSAFRYLDDSLRAAVGVLADRPGLLARTLLVVLADHACPCHGADRLERLRIPILFHHPRLAERGLVARRSDRASPVDVLPTVLELLGGRHPYAGMGRSLLRAREGGVLSAARTTSLYLEGDLALEWTLAPDGLRLFDLCPSALGARDLCSERPADLERLRRAHFALYETARRLSLSRRIVP